MGWGSAIKKKSAAPSITNVVGAKYELAKVDWDRLVTLDFETYYDLEYTLKKMSTSEYVRDPRFKAQMVGIKIGNKKTRTFTGAAIARELKKINWATHSLLAHNTAFDGLILSHHYGIVPLRYYDTLSMARGLHSNEIGAGLDEVALFYGGQGKIQGALESTLGVLNWSKQLTAAIGAYCERDVDECFRIFTEMHKVFPASEMDLTHITIRMFCDPVLRVDIPRVQAEYEREVAKRKEAMLAAVPDPSEYDAWDEKGRYRGVLDKKSGRDTLEGDERHMAVVKKVVGSNEKFVDLLTRAGLPEEAIPRKISPAWMKLDKEEREAQIDRKWSYAFAKDDLDFVDLPERVWEIRPDLDPNNEGDVMRAVAIQERLRGLVDVRLVVKSTTNITRAERFLEAGKDGMKLPVGYSYYRAHTGRFGGNNKMNCLPGESEVLTPAGWVRLDSFASGAQAAVWDANTGRINFAEVGLVVKDYAGPMIRAKTKSGTHDALYTPDHGLPVARYRAPTKVERKTAAEMVGSSDWLLPVSGVYEAPLPCDISPEVARFAACMQADGSIVQNSEHSQAAAFAFKKARKITRFREICQKAGLRFTETVSGEYTRFYVAHGQAPVQMFKYFGEWLLRLTPRALAALVDEAAYWDGHVRGKSYIYASSVKSNAEWLQTAAHLVGRSAQMQVVSNCRGWNKDPDAMLYIVNVKQRAHVINEKSRTPLTTEDGYVGKVYCLTTPTGWFMMRHNGTIHVTGNCQNLIRGGELRLSILADKGHAMAVCDSGQIEARVNAWLWGQEELVEAFRAGRDIYCEFATLVYGRTITKEDKTERHVGKASQLGLGFGMSGAKFQMTLAKGALGGPRVNFPLDQCNFIVNTYRSTNYRIAQGWKQCGRIIEDMAVGADGEYKCLRWGGDEDGNGWIALPNGMRLKYPQLRKTRNADTGWDEWSYQSGDVRKKIYSSMLTENIVQALARIIVMEQMLMIDKKYRCVMTTHDEVVAHPKLREAEKCYQFMYQCMTTPLWWCPDIPLAAEGGWAENYSK